MTVNVDDPWIRFARSDHRPRLRLFCFPYAGGGASAFRTWQHGLPPEIEVCPVQLPGREDRFADPLLTRLDDLLRVLVRVLMPYEDLPFAFFGHSMGALISFELARGLRARKHHGPIHLFVAGCAPPQEYASQQALHSPSNAQLLEQLRHLKGTPEEVLQNHELMTLVLPIVRADFEIWQTYAYSKEDPIECPISAFGGLEDDRATNDVLKGWRYQTSRRFNIRMLPGDHFFLHSSQEQLLRYVSEDLTSTLNQIDAQEWM